VALAAVAVLMAGVAALAAYLPARGVGRLDPVETLRSD
jgi:ABC-type lipoprotein release transport system permease subunit